MFKNYFITAFRNFWRNKIFSIINVLGLSIGISAALVIFLIAYYEFSYDKFEPGRDRIYRVVLDAKFNGDEVHSAAVPAPLSGAIQNEVTGVEQTVPIMQFQGDGTAKVSVVKEGTDKPPVFKKQPDIVYTNPQYFYLVPHKWIAGSPKSSLQDPFNVVLTESRAKLYFPSLSASDIIGRQINYNDDITATVSGIVQDLNEHTSFTAVEFISFATIAKTHLQDKFMMNVWNDWMAYSNLYVKLAEGGNAQQTEAQLKMLLNKYNKDANKDAANTMSFRLQPLNDVHFNSLYNGFGQRIAHKPTLYGLFAIAAFLLLLACINFINLTTANASQRAKEIGIRKTMGSSRKQLVFQFLGETFFITVIASVISVVITPLLLQFFADFIPPGLRFDLQEQPYVVVFLCMLTVFVSFISGLYPALILSGYKPVIVLKNQAFTNGSETRHAWIRKALTVSQFVVAQFFIIGTMMVSKQINYSLNTDLGFNKEGIITFVTPRDTAAVHGQQLINAINAIPEVEVASRGFLSPAEEGAAFSNVSYTPKPEIKAQVQIRWGDPNYFKVYGIKLLAGRNVEPSDTIKELIINNTYAKLLGFQEPEDAIGKQLDISGKSKPIVGVMHDFHDQSMHTPITPLIFEGRTGGFFHIRLKPNTPGGIMWQTAIAKIQKAFKQIYPDEDFDYKFYDDTIASFYASEQRTASLLKWATGLTIFISCLGLLGLVMYTINTRRKEIGIRKVLGASVANIVSVLSADFMQLVFLAFVIAAPLAWWAIYEWLQDYAYRTTMSWWVFIVSGSAMLLIALITLSIQTIKAATANPVKSLRTE
ncbi:FtsX-like permease family protein [Ilyomonas limi]|uniref:FtsX-like permease family protein n=1 Tax=Ilyomonas limi TaxID=2575867 RepID=A0A4U3L400_9BACT|nr:ABC transporter permease [Ilyomonas limi]TKK68267.1 FtsX-like permease family protein [Ilyomonas limi]